MRSAFAAVLLLALLGALRAQEAGAGNPKDDEEVRKAALKDPYTEGDKERMAKAGIVSYAPFPWADFLRTEDIERVLGEGRILWLETAHFRIGSTLKSSNLPDDNTNRKALFEETDRLHDKLPKIPAKPKRLDPWMRAHLYAQRAEDLFTDFTTRLGIPAGFEGKEPPNGPVLGLGDKFLVLLFQRNSDLARYLDRFCGLKGDKSFRYYHAKTHQMLFVVGVDGFENLDDVALHSHFTYMMVANFAVGYRGYSYSLPHWLAEGLAHWYSRQIDTDFINAKPKDGEAVDRDSQSEWPRKVRARAVHEGTTIPFAEMMAWKDWRDLGYQGAIQAWSRVDYLMQHDSKKLGEMLVRLKSLPVPLDGIVAPEQLVQAQTKALIELFEMEPATFDESWREWVLKTYPKR